MHKCRAQFSGYRKIAEVNRPRSTGALDRSGGIMYPLFQRNWTSSVKGSLAKLCEAGLCLRSNHREVKMPESRSHRTAANRIARKYRTEYNEGPGADIQTSQAAVEVEPAESIPEAKRQLQGYRKRVYIAGTNQKAVEKALEATKGTTIGVMDSQGNIIKPSTRKKG